MDWGAKIFSYCERGADPAFWAEPLNAVSNVAFIIAAGAALGLWAELRTRERPASLELVLVVLVSVIGIGSFLFHTYATRWAVLADVLPITVFMIAYLGFALVRFAGAGWPATIALLGLFVFSLKSAEGVTCGAGPCLNGSVGYLPALGALALVGGWLAWRRHSAAAALIGGAALFAISLTLRTIDRPLCPTTALLGGRALGTHFLWHIANATLLYMLLRGALKFGAPQIK